MHRTLLAGLLVLVACRPSGQTFVIAGQSNATGRSSLAAPVPFPNEAGTAAWALTTWGEFRLASDPLTAPSHPWRSPWPFFAEARLAAGAPTPFVVQTAEAATCLIYARADGEPRWSPTSGDLYLRMLALAAEARARRFPRIVAVLWHQGECDANKPGTATEVGSAYRDALLELADHVGADLGVPIVAARIVPRGPREIAIREAVVEAAALHPGVLVGPDVADLEHEPDGLHVRDVVTLGRRWADAVAAAGW